MTTVHSVLRSTYDFFASLFSHGVEGAVIGVIVMLVGLVVIGTVLFIVWLIGYGIFRAIDSWFLTEQVALGCITGKHYTPPSTTFMPIISGNVTTMIPAAIPEDQTVSVRVGQKKGTMSVNPGYYENVRVGDHVNVYFVTGRISGRLYLRKLSS